ncbi:MAG: class I SAM-dependent methyltransferase [Clostridiales bacterium]|nr:class I SAM-dependent methyltransferase [Clostridiales bacterium]
MTGGQYTSIARFYDVLNSGVDYASWASSTAARLKELGVPDGAIVLDLACGSGALTVELAVHGYDMIGCDISGEMLDVARQRPVPEGVSVFWTEQDMRSFELYGTVGAVVCCLDSLNYLTKKADVEKCFSLCHNYLDPGGIFIFDVNTPRKFRTVYACRDYIMEEDGIFCGWSNVWNERTKTCRFILTFFEEYGDGTWTRSDETQTERCWEMRTLKELLKKTGFELLGVGSTPDMDPVTPETERWHFEARCVKRI